MAYGKLHLESCVAAKLACKKAVSLLLQFWLSVGLIREEQIYRRLDWSLKKCLHKIQSSFLSSFVMISEVIVSWFCQWLGQHCSWGNLCLCPRNLVATVVQTFLGVSVLALRLLWQHLACIPYGQVCDTDCSDGQTEVAASCHSPSKFRVSDKLQVRAHIVYVQEDPCVVGVNHFLHEE